MRNRAVDAPSIQRTARAFARPAPMKTLVTATRDSARLAPANTETGAAVDAARTMTAICVLSPNSARKRKPAVSQNGCRAKIGRASCRERVAIEVGGGVVEETGVV